MKESAKEILKVITGMVRELTEGDYPEITPETEIMAVDTLDSIDRAEMMMMIEEHWKTTLPDRVIVDLKTFGDLSDAVAGRIGL